MDFSDLLEAIKGPQGSPIRLCLIRDMGSSTEVHGFSSTIPHMRPYEVTLLRSRVQGVGVIGSFASPPRTSASRSPSPTSSSAM